jgi:hypothetical protein
MEVRCAFVRCLHAGAGAGALTKQKQKASMVVGT